jgi:UDP-N-acetyl-2-amino-2-deoxyglucuronate dehydrogenase
VTEPIRTGLVGCGKVGLTHAQALAALPRSRFSAVCDADTERARQFAERFGVQAYRDVEEMCRAEGLGMISVCTPHPIHADAVVAAAAGGASALVEKPFTADLASADRAIAAVRAAGVKLGVMSQRRWYRPVARLRRAIDDGTIGRPILANVTVLGWRDEAYYRSDPWRGRWSTEGGGVLVNQTPHQLDLLLWLLGPVRQLYGQWDNFNHPSIEVEDTAVAVIRFESGALATLMLSNSQNPGLYGRIHVHGSSGATVGVQTEGGSMFISGVSTEVDPPFNDLWTVPGEAGLLAGWQAEDRLAARVEDPLTFYHERQVEDFLEAIAADRAPAVSGEDGRRVVELFTALYRSQRDGAPITFPLVAEDGDDFDGRLAHSRPAAVGNSPA